jgi:hypothetical protein
MEQIRQDIVRELHRPTRRKFNRRSIVVKGILDLVQADLVDMKAFARVNKNYKYCLVAIDVFSKIAFVQPLKNKTGQNTTDAMEIIMEKFNGHVKNLQTDEGKEFYCKPFRNLMERLNINHYSTHSVVKVRIMFGREAFFFCSHVTFSFTLQVCCG